MASFALTINKKGACLQYKTAVGLAIHSFSVLSLKCNKHIGRCTILYCRKYVNTVPDRTTF